MKSIRKYQDATYYIHKEVCHFILGEIRKGNCSFSDTNKMQEMVDREFFINRDHLRVDVSCLYRAVEIAEMLEDK